MGPRYRVGEKVVVAPGSEGPAARSSELKPFVGQSGRISDYYYLNMNSSADTVYIYVVKLETGNKRIVLHEDELEAALTV